MNNKSEEMKRDIFSLMDKYPDLGFLIMVSDDGGTHFMGTGDMCLLCSLEELAEYIQENKVKHLCDFIPSIPLEKKLMN